MRSASASLEQQTGQRVDSTVARGCCTLQPRSRCDSRIPFCVSLFAFSLSTLASTTVSQTACCSFFCSSVFATTTFAIVASSLWPWTAMLHGRDEAPGASDDVAAAGGCLCLWLRGRLQCSRRIRNIPATPPREGISDAIAPAAQSPEVVSVWCLPASRQCERYTPQHVDLPHERDKEEAAAQKKEGATRTPTASGCLRCCDASWEAGADTSFCCDPRPATRVRHRLPAWLRRQPYAAAGQPLEQ